MVRLSIVIKGETMISVYDKTIANSIIAVLLNENVTIETVVIKHKDGTDRPARKFIVQELIVLQLAKGELYFHLQKGTNVNLYTDV